MPASSHREQRRAASCGKSRPIVIRRIERIVDHRVGRIKQIRPRMPSRPGDVHHVYGNAG